MAKKANYHCKEQHHQQTTRDNQHSALVHSGTAPRNFATQEIYRLRDELNLLKGHPESTAQCLLCQFCTQDCGGHFQGHQQVSSCNL